MFLSILICTCSVFKLKKEINCLCSSWTRLKHDGATTVCWFWLICPHILRIHVIVASCRTQAKIMRNSPSAYQVLLSTSLTSFCLVAPLLLLFNYNMIFFQCLVSIHFREILDSPQLKVRKCKRCLTHDLDKVKRSGRALDLYVGTVCTL